MGCDRISIEGLVAVSSMADILCDLTDKLLDRQVAEYLKDLKVQNFVLVL